MPGEDDGQVDAVDANWRIGETERADAQRALQQHLNAGRLQVAEFVQRFTGAADAGDRGGHRRVVGPSYGVDLDDVASPTWNVGPGCCGRDVGFGSDGGRLSTDGGHAVVTGPLGFATCFHETAYTDAPRRAREPAARRRHVRADERSRLALVTIVAVSEQAVEFGATVWDPPVPS